MVRTLLATPARVWLLLMLSFTLTATLPSCKAKKQAQADREAAALVAAQTEQAKTDLIALLSDSDTRSLAEKEAALQALKDLGLSDPEVQNLINQVEAKLNAEKKAQAEAERLASEQAKIDQERIQMEARQRAINNAFANIARTGSQSDINATMDMFSNGDVPVLIVISESGGQKDYEKPTNIRLYMDHLRDTRSVEERVTKIWFDDAGKIREVEMAKIND